MSRQHSPGARLLPPPLRAQTPLRTPICPMTERRPLMRWGSHNVNGLSKRKLPELLRSWRTADYDALLLQETHLTFFTVVSIARTLMRRGWTSYFAHGPLGPSGRPTGGTAILIRTRLISSGAFTVVGDDTAVMRLAEGRCIALHARWSAHDLLIASIYLPNPSAAQRQYISDHLAPLAATGHQLLWGGDFNFTPSIPLDRLHGVAGAAHPDNGTQQHWQAHLPTLRDAWRERHPGRRAYTYIHTQSASRLDRFYTSPALLTHIPSCSIGRRSLGDHRPISLTLIGLEPSTTGPGLRRARVAFTSLPHLQQSMRDWLDRQRRDAPADHTALLIWWPQFTRAAAAQCAALTRASRLLAADAEATGDQLAALHTALDRGEEVNLAAIIEARQRFIQAARVSEAEASLRRRQRWLHAGERPRPGLTARLRPRQHDRVVPALQSATGQLLTSGPACAQRVADYWADVSAQPTTDAAARQEVLQALATGRRLSADQAAALASTAMSAAEVAKALRTAPPGKAPGLDGLPVELYRRFKGTMVPLLARLFTAIATTGDMPLGFHLGLISTIHKSGDRTDPGNYRPITLLNTAYRLYAKTLALRLNPCLPAIIDREQTAFVPGREIGENILLMQCLPHLLRHERHSAVAIFCDFRKAYDTVDREFLFRAMLELGVGEGFLALVRPLLADTRARAMVNGHISTPAASAAGVRQGCPLAPLLYLFFAQALLRLLTARGVGIQVAGRALTALQYADDAIALVPTLDAVAPFLAAMATFGAATGQHLNLGKTLLLPIGRLPPGLPGEAHGLRVMATAKTLGVTFGSAANAEDPEAALAAAASWPALMEGVHASYTKLATLPLSVFGRGIASAAYGVSKILYHAEFTGHPPAAAAQDLERWTARVVDRKAPPTGGAPGFAGLASRNLFGAPRDGGFGTLPWQEHVSSRHAKWALHLLAADDDVPWAAVAWALLAHCTDAAALHPLGLALWPAGQPPPGSIALLPPPLRRLHAGLRALPPLEDVADTPLQPGAWCWAVPLWGNPFFRSLAHPQGIDEPFIDLMAAGIATIGHLLHTWAAVRATIHNAAAYHLVWHAQLNLYPPLRTGTILACAWKR